MISNTGSLGWRSLQPFVSADQSCLPQALVLTAEVVNRGDHIHPCFKRSALPCYGSPSSHKTRQALPERGVESFYERRVDYSSTLRKLKHSFNLCLRAFNDSPLDADHTPLLMLFNSLRNEDSFPELQARTARLTTHRPFTKHQSNSRNVSLQPICAEQDASTQGRSRSTHLLNHSGYQSPISADANYTTQPEACAYHQSHSHPYYSALLFDTKFIHLYLTQITRGGNKLFVQGLAMEPGALLPTRNGALIKIECSNDGLSRAAKGKQSDNLRDKLLRMAKAVKGGARSLSEGLFAGRAFVAALFERVNANVAFIDFASGRTVHIRTKYSKRVQAGNPFENVSKPKGLSLDPCFIQKHFLHVLLWSYPTPKP
jgi:hypothetical protein